MQKGGFHAIEESFPFTIFPFHNFFQIQMPFHTLFLTFDWLSEVSAPPLGGKKKVGMGNGNTQNRDLGKT